jgi:polyhydroxyalkanoate synthesis regulator phasin
MKRTVKYALSAVLATAIVVPAIAQDNFPDVPENHWAYEALGRLKKDGILVGFPDGKYRGARPATRYELAIAINAAYTKLKDLTEDLDKQIAALSAKLDGKANQSDIDDVKKGLEDLKSQLGGISGYASDIADLKKLSDKFEKELASIGVDVDELKKNLSDLDKRVTALENKKLPVDIHGDLNALVLGGYSTNGTFGITVDGRPTGVGRGSYAGVPSGVNRDLTVLHEVGLELDSTNTTGPKWKIVGAAGNMIGTGSGANAPFGSQNSTLAGTPFGEGSAAAIYFQNFELMLDEKVGGLNFSADLGRVGFKVSPYIFQRPDTTPYFTNDRWDNGEYSIDGGVLGFNIGAAKLSVVAGRASAEATSNGVMFQSLTAGTTGVSPYLIGTSSPTQGLLAAGTVDQMLGGTLMVPILGHSSVNVSYLLLDSNTNTVTPSGAANRVAVYGGDLKLNGVLPFGISAAGGYSRTDVMENGSKVISGHNQRATGELAWEKDQYGLKGGYRYIEPNYAAPGDWGRIGLWWNPTDIKGPVAEGYFNFSKTLGLKATGEYYNGTGLSGGFLSNHDKVTRLTADLTYKFMTNASVDLGVESVDWTFSTTAHPTTNGLKPYERWYSLGFGYDLSNNTMLKVMWQISDYNSKGQPGWTVFGQPTAKGGLITTQLSIKF